MGFFKARYVRDYVAAAKVKSVLLWIVEIIAVLVLGVFLAVGFGKTTVMQEGSMDPTLNAGDTLLINRTAYRFSSPKRGDIIVFKLSDDQKASTHIKRIVGLPGETIQIKEGQILIDGEIYQEKQGFPMIQNAGMADRKLTLKKDEYFVLGDNRNNSEDSRFVDMGNIKEKNIIGKLWFVISPKDRFGFISDGD
ncbi:MAG: signal peptidase I [Oliverpabstia sp.]|nr:signal peptidase I [Oliverpabstia sp.]